jgi:Zn-dependent M28 family amino/carboxypeptidase
MSQTIGQRLLTDVRRLCEFGPRPAGSQASLAQRNFLADHFTNTGARVTLQPFQVEHPLTGETLDLANLIASFSPTAQPRRLVAAHGDTRPIPDREPTHARRLLPFVGANDGASALSILMELARDLARRNQIPAVDLVVFDAEELIIDGRGEYCLGSHHFAERFLEQDEVHYAGAVVLDMVGRIGLAIDRERYSQRFAPALTSQIWSIAKNQASSVFRDRLGRAIVDDHLPLLEAGIESIVLIDLEDPRWHTADDLPEFCSPDSMAQVTRVVLEWLLAC